MTAFKTTVRLAVIAAGAAILGTAAASAGEWKFVSEKCPEVRVEHWDHHKYEHVDHRRITCPEGAWEYVYGPGEHHMRKLPPRPVVEVYRDGRHYYKDPKGVQIDLNF